MDDKKAKIMIIISICVVVLLGVFVVAPAMLGHKDGATSVIDEAQEGYDFEAIFK